ncbi:MAG: type 1 glutamine amidotransferase [Proteobacteria bacterium]|nr:type 1 glutamine amidotransferase [Pseudomonadota bacterium]
MSNTYRFLIIDGYSKESRDDLESAGMQLAWNLYAQMLQRYLPEAEYEVLLPSDPGVSMPNNVELEGLDGIVWTGCNLCINDTHLPSVANQIELAERAYEVGVPSWGSCWGVQMAAVAAGGEVQANPKGREMGLARKVLLTPEGRNHPMYEGKSHVFDAYISHDDIVTRLPPGAVLLAGNDFSEVQALAVTHKKGTFWATQYHPEYDLHEMASLIVAREKKLTDMDFFQGHDDFAVLVERMKALHAEPIRKDLRWQLAIDDDVLDRSIRQLEFVNWIEKLVKPSKQNV